VICLNGKNYLVAVLLCSMILALTFIQNSGSQASKQYDPWMDINDDGRIDMRDITQLCINFMATGDPTKNVNVTNWPPIQKVEVALAHYDYFGSVSVKAGNYTYLWFDIEGYRQVSVYCWFYAWPAKQYALWIKMGRLEKEWPGGSYYTTFFKIIDTPNYGNFYCETFPVCGPHLGIDIWNYSNSTVTAQIGIYITA